MATHLDQPPGPASRKANPDPLRVAPRLIDPTFPTAGSPDRIPTASRPAKVVDGPATPRRMAWPDRDRRVLGR